MNNQFRRKRPTFETAHAYQAEGIFSTGPEHWLSDNERTAIWDGAKNDLLGLVKTQFPRTQNLEFAILKGHLILERAILQFIRCHARVFVEEKDISFSFKQKLEIAFIMGFGVDDPTVLPSVERWNKIRNQVAHSFYLDRSLVDEMLQVNSDDYDGFSMKNDRARITMLRKLCGWICAWTAARISLHTYFETEQQEFLRTHFLRGRQRRQRSGDRIS